MSIIDMNWRYFLGIFIAVFFLITAYPPVYADAEYLDSDKFLYQYGDTITFSGSAGNSNSHENISVIIKNLNDDFVALVSNTSDASGTFELKVDVNSHFVEKGQYFAELFIDDVASNEKTYFDFSPDGSEVVYSTEKSFLMNKSSKLQYGELVSIEEIKLVNSIGSKVEFVVEDEPIQISSDIVNLEDKNQLYTYIVQIRDEKNVVIYISWFSGMMSGDQILNVAVSWIPEDKGSYQTDVFVWESFSDVIPLSEPETIPIIVT